MLLRKEEIGSVFDEYNQIFKIDGEEISFRMKPLTAIQKSGVALMWEGRPEEAQAFTLKACVVGWNGVDATDSNGVTVALPFTFDNLNRLLTLKPELQSQLNKHIGERNKLFAPAESQKENFTAPPSE